MKRYGTTEESTVVEKDNTTYREVEATHEGAHRQEDTTPKREREETDVPPEKRPY